jgi:hypothetical protein
VCPSPETELDAASKTLAALLENLNQLTARPRDARAV